MRGGDDVLLKIFMFFLYIPFFPPPSLSEKAPWLRLDFAQGLQWPDEPADSAASAAAAASAVSLCGKCQRPINGVSGKAVERGEIFLAHASWLPFLFLCVFTFRATLPFIEP